MLQKLDAKQRVINMDMIQAHVQQVLLQLVILPLQLATVLLLAQPRVTKLIIKKKLLILSNFFFKSGKI